ncbi:OVARIAN TUMOR DOMAIN-containing deubiquitinating enzyme 1-like [Phragmites australis]|uniref:OVARIAN TUMOR DOMAIN-containing deubiquitinating enzyme 1-like n=1 Tax=Phragmites australis TaxID=29695 RepID=UPI002D792E65|nr:OVARIAN TUMOR DOMAIN-containing deubiquitinating enzyme 1-like [Phragmites australis]
MGFKIKFKQLLQSSAGSSADGGGATPPPSPRRKPPPSPLRPSLPPDDQDEDLEEEQYKPENSGFRCLLMSFQQNIPRYIDRHKCEPLTKREYFSLRHKWRQLLAGKRTYLRPPNNNRVPEYNYDDFLFQNPEPLLRTLGRQEPLLVLVRKAAKNPVIQQKFKILSKHYVCFRRTRKDGCCFYRAFLFSYLENLGQMQNSQAEVTRLMECVATSRENLCRLKWDKSYFLNPEAFFSSVVSEFRHLVNSVANGLSADELYKRSLQEIMSFRILSFLRLLTEIEIRTHEEDYKSWFPLQKNALWYCIKAVRPTDVEATELQMRALSYALGIPLRLVVVDSFLKDGVVQVQHVDFLPRSESGISTTSGPLDSIESYSLSSTTDKPPEQGRNSNSVMQVGVSTCDNLSSDGMPLVTLLYKKGQRDILYRK